MARRLKVYRTPIGFHDAYVAASSQKAALEAWGTDRNLFARGEAEIVEDAALTEEPLARPGEVIKRSRGTTAQQIAALPADEPKRPVKAATTKPPRKPATPRPSRNALDEAERDLAEAKERFAEQHRDLRARERALLEERRALDREEADTIGAAEVTRDTAETAYRRAVAVAHS